MAALLLILAMLATSPTNPAVGTDSQPVWRRSSDNAFNRYAPAALAGFLSSEQQARAERLRQAEMLFDGRHREYFLGEARTDYGYKAVPAKDGTLRPLYARFNLLRLAAVKNADLMFGEAPRVTFAGAGQDPTLDQIADRSSAHARLHGAAVSVSWAGGAYLEVCRHAGEVYIANIAPEQIYPIGGPLPDGQYAAYARYAVRDLGSTLPPIQGRQVIEFPTLLETRYEPGVVRRTLYRLSGVGRRLEVLPLRLWTHGLDESAVPPETPELPPVEATGLRRASIVFLPNEIGQGGGGEDSDYDGLIETQDLVNAKNSQLAWALWRHGDPRFVVPKSSADENGNFPGGEVIFQEPDDPDPKYVDWDAKLDHHLRDRDNAVDTLIAEAEGSRALYGLRIEGREPESARGLKLTMTNPVAKATRKAAAMAPAVRLVFGLAATMEDTSPLTARAAPGRRASESVSVEFRDGLPIDETEQMNNVVAGYSGGVMSRRKSVLTLNGGDEAAADAELALLDEDDAKRTPSLLLGEPGESPTPDDDEVRDPFDTSDPAEALA